MYNEPTGGWIMVLFATLLALWTYRLSKKSEEAHNKAFENIEFLGQKYLCVHHEEKEFRLRLTKLIEMIKQGSFGLLYENEAPQMVLLPINEFYRLKVIEEHLEDMEIARIIKERINTRDKNIPNPIEDFDRLREQIYTQYQKENGHE